MSAGAAYDGPDAEALKSTGAGARVGRHGAQATGDLARVTPTRTYAGLVWRGFRRDRLALVGLVVVLVMVALTLGAGLISEHVTGYTTYEQDLTARFAPIGGEGHLLGTDDIGRDTATRLLYGARVSLGVAGLSIAVALVIGLGIGIVAGYFGTWVDGLLMRLVDVMLSVPTLFLLLLVGSMWRMGPLSLALVIAAVSWATLARLVRGEVLSLTQRDYVQAAVVMGASHRRVMLRHILPNVAPVVIVWASLTIPILILAEASLSYLGLGIQLPQPSLGNMLSNSQRVWSHSAALVFLPGLTIYLTVFAINLVGNGLRDALDPRLAE
jgi:peptide/nickel transport system permease protein